MHEVPNVMFQPRKLSARRRLIVCCIILATLFTLSYIENDSRLVAEVDNSVAVVGVAKTPTTNHTDAEVEAAVREAIALAGGLPANVGPGKKIVIQPNLVEAGWPASDVDPGMQPCRGVVTDVRVVRTIIEMCIEAGATVDNITICEGAASFREGTTHPGYTTRQMTRKAFYDAGFDSDRDMVDDVTHVKLVDANFVREDQDAVYPDYPEDKNDDYNTDRVTKVQFANESLITRNYFIPNCVAECDVLIRVPVLKTHDLAGYTGALKLAFGIAPSDIYHYDGVQYYKWNLLHKYDVPSWGSDQLVINTSGMVDMTIARPPDLVVIDGLVGIKTGPTRCVYGEPVPRTADPYMSVILASHDPVAIDTVGTLAIGYRVSSIPGIVTAADQGLGQNHPGLIDIRGVQLDEFRQWWPKHPLNTWPSGEPGNNSDIIMSDLTIPDNAHAGGTIAIKPKSVMIPNLVCKSELYVDGELKTSSLNSAMVTWNVGDDIADGAHQIKYVLYDMMLKKVEISKTIYTHKGNAVSSILGQPDGTTVYLSPVYHTGRATTIDNYTFFVSTMDGISGLRVVRPSGSYNWPIGYELTLNGTLGTVNGERVMTLAYYTNGATKQIATPRAFLNSALGGAALGDGLGVDEGVGPYNVGCFVRTSGKVVAGGSNYFYISDGSLADDPAGANRLKVYSGSIAQPAPGKHVRLTGWSCTDNDGGVIRRMLVLRSSSDIVTYN